jgi:hypothetical protein
MVDDFPHDIGRHAAAVPTASDTVESWSDSVLARKTA